MNPVLLPDAEWFDLAAPADGSRWRIFLSRPRSAAPAAGWPAVFQLDANAGFMTFVETMRRAAVRPAATGVSEAVIVGIGYPGGEDFRARRSFDYTAGPCREAGGEGRPEAARPVGGRDAFLAFLDTVLKPEIARRLPVDPVRRRCSAIRWPAGSPST